MNKNKEKINMDLVKMCCKKARRKLLLFFLETRYAKSIKHLDVNTLPRDKEIIVSFTSYPKRIQQAKFVASSMLNQTMKPDRVILWLARDQFPAKTLPKDYDELQNRGLSIKWCENLKAHKKYLFSIQMHPNSLIITVDDDLIYNNRLVETLYREHQQFPHAICAMRAHRMRFNSNNLLPYNDWEGEVNIRHQPRFDLFATGGAGALYPPSALNNEIFNRAAIYELCLNADDVWLKAMEILAGTPVVLCGIRQKLISIPCTQDDALYKYNVAKCENDYQIEAVFDKYGILQKLHSLMVTPS
jgi:hypothetical protein